MTGRTVLGILGALVVLVVAYVVGSRVVAGSPRASRLATILADRNARRPTPTPAAPPPAPIGRETPEQGWDFTAGGSYALPNFGE